MKVEPEDKLASADKITLQSACRCRVKLEEVRQSQCRLIL